MHLAGSQGLIPGGGGGGGGEGGGIWKASLEISGKVRLNEWAEEAALSVGPVGRGHAEVARATQRHKTTWPD